MWPCVLSSWLASERAAAGRRIRHVCLGAAETLFEQLPDYTLPPQMLEAHERGALGARNVLGETAFRDAWMAGRTMAIDQAVSLGLGLPALANPPLQGELPASGRSGRCERSISQLRDQSALVMVCHSRTATDGIRFPMKAPSMSWSM